MMVTYPIKACPWCGVTGSFHMGTEGGKTWLPTVSCKNLKCNVQPTTKYVPIRKKQKEVAEIIRTKIERVIKFWNDGVLDFKNEGFQLDFDQIVQNYLSGKIGLKGYRQEEAS